MSMFRQRWVLLIIVLAAAVLRVWGIGSQELLGDEGAYAFRSLGYLDYLGTSFQTQPVDWFAGESLPWWISLSFHDHPPLGFAIRHIFFFLFGDSIVAARLSGILFSLASVVFSYLAVQAAPISNERAKQWVALLTAGFMGVESVSVWISRAVLLEPFLITFAILTVYAFFLFLKNPRWWPLVGLMFGALALTKYTGAFVVAVILAYLAVWKRDRFKEWRLYAAFTLGLLLFSPVLIYNFALYRSTGHFDLQLAYAFGQETPEWTGLIGKSQFPASEAFSNLVALYGPFLVLVTFGAGCALWVYAKRPDYRRALSFLFFCFVALSALIAVTGSAPRFLSLFGIPFAAFAAIGVYTFTRAASSRTIIAIVLVSLFAGECLFTLQRTIFAKEDNGVTSLDRYLARELKDITSAVIPESSNNHLNEVIRKHVLRKSEAVADDFVVIIYNENIALPALLWVVYRRFLYNVIRVLYVEIFMAVTAERPDIFEGFTAYFIQSTPNTLRNPFKEDRVAGNEFEAHLIEQSFAPTEVVTDSGGREMFRVYRFML